LSNTRPLAVAGAQPARLKLEGPGQAQLGAEFDVALKITSTVPVSAWPMQVGFDPEVVEMVAVRPGAAVSSAQARDFSFTLIRNGTISIAASNPVAAPLADAQVVELTFRPLQPGTTAEVWISALRLQDAAGRALDYDVISPIKIPVIP
jgi:hypothetical protein